MNAPRTPRVDLEHRVGITGAPPPPALEGAPLLGHVLDFVRDPFGLFLRGYEAHGPVFEIRTPGRRFVGLGGAEGIRWMGKHERELLTAAPIWRSFVELFGGKLALVNAEGDVHSELRKRVRPTMNKRALVRHARALEAVLDAQLAKIDRPVDLPHFARELVYLQLAIAMGMDHVDPTAHYDDLVRSMHVGLEVTVARRWPSVLLKVPAVRRAFARTRQLGLLLRSTAGSEDGLSTVLDKAVRDGLLEEDDTALLAITPYFAGIDTVAAALSFALAELYRRPSLRARVAAEARAARNDDGTLDVDRLKLAAAVKQETMRRHPVTVGSIREAVVDFELGGYQVRKGDQLFAGSGSQGWMPSLFERPMSFEPERFLDPSLHVPPGALQPYGMGPHTCLGASLADAQLTMLIALFAERSTVALWRASRPLETAYDPYPLPKNDQLVVWA